jgi:hypothetical protein
VICSLHQVEEDEMGAACSLNGWAGGGGREEHIGC